LLVNCLVPQSGDIHILAQKRNSSQSFYEVDYRQTAAVNGRASIDAGRGVK
jgi:hypothetical protein